MEEDMKAQVDNLTMKQKINPTRGYITSSMG